MADEIARRAVEQERLNSWCAAAGIETPSDLAALWPMVGSLLAGRANQA